MPPVCVFLLLVCTTCFRKGYSHSYEKLREQNTDFAVRLYRTLVETENRTNLVVSPSSVASSLGLLLFGARGSTFTQIENALGYSVLDESVESFMKEVHRGLVNSSRDCSMHLACALFVQTGTPLSAKFIEEAALWANSSLHQNDFTEHNETASQINQWITRNAGGGIQRLVPCGPFAPGFTQIALVSTMYFRSKWKTQFPFTDTQTLPFNSMDGSVIKVPMMHQTADVNYGQFQTASFEKFTVIELPYLGNTVSMFVVRPTDRNTPLSSIEARLTSKSIAQWTNSMKRFKMDVFLPRFKLQSYSDLKVVLPALGVLDLFDPKRADFKGISAMVLLKRSRMPVFKADRPFFFFLRQASSGSVLFIGRVTNPLH
ncbi:serpin E3 isoform X2 [Hyperolius riggenbachi]|uniref:serpin E3 isoform X2 n=1 Tax=Hyperolius riggenbachi TaxID=752182 RepID=UPI0035A398C4